MAFSYTAPRVSREQEEQEFESLSESELNHIYGDIFGTEDDEDLSTNISSPSSAPDLAQSKLDVAIAGLSAASKASYLKALQVAPNLVQTESSPVTFMERSKFDMKKAARQLAMYWTTREKFFQERAFQPMTQQGALSQDHATLNLGIFRILQDDQHGRGVMYLHRAGIVANSKKDHRESLLRVCFYLMHCLRDKQRGIIVQLNLKGFDVFANFDRILLKSILTTIFSSSCCCYGLLPKAWHVLASRSAAFTDMILPSVKHMMGRENRLRIVLHSDHIVYGLGRCGIGEASIAEEVGGSFQLEHFRSWVLEQAHFEEATVSSNSSGGNDRDPSPDDHLDDEGKNKSDTEEAAV